MWFVVDIQIMHFNLVPCTSNQIALYPPRMHNIPLLVYIAGACCQVQLERRTSIRLLVAYSATWRAPWLFGTHLCYGHDGIPFFWHPQLMIERQPACKACRTVGYTPLLTAWVHIESSYAWCWDMDFSSFFPHRFQFDWFLFPKIQIARYLFENIPKESLSEFVVICGIRYSRCRVRKTSPV
jgi:hypothetical protein